MKVIPGTVVSTTALGVVLSLAGAAQAADAPKAPTFTKDIAPIFQAKCESCHRPDNMAPMSLISYEEARPWAKSIASRVGARQMPPWHIDKTIGIQKFANDRSLNDDQIETILAWVAAGSPKGDPKDMPPPKVWKDETGLEPGQQVRPAGPRREVARIHDAGGRAGRVVAADRARPASPSRAGSARLKSVRSARTPARLRTTRSPACSSRKTCSPSSSRTIRTSPATASSWNGRSARTATRCVPTRAV